MIRKSHAARNMYHIKISPKERRGPLKALHAMSGRKAMLNRISILLTGRGRSSLLMCFAGVNFASIWSLDVISLGRGNAPLSLRSPEHELAEAILLALPAILVCTCTHGRLRSLVGGRSIPSLAERSTK